MIYIDIYINIMYLIYLIIYLIFLFYISISIYSNHWLGNLEKAKKKIKKNGNFDLEIKYIFKNFSNDGKKLISRMFVSLSICY